MRTTDKMERVKIGCVALLLALACSSGAYTPSVVCRMELDREVLPAGTDQKAVVKITLDTIAPPRTRERPPVNLCIVLDRSSSMNGRKIEHAREAAIAALRRLGPDDLFSLVVYDNGVETLIPAQRAANTEWMEARIRQISPRGTTALYGGVAQGAAEIRKNLDSRHVHRIILLSDGQANVGPSSPVDLGRLGASLMKEQISVSTVGVGNDYNEDLMGQLARQSDGNTYYVEDSQDLPRIFAAELGDVLSVVAKQVILDVQFENGARPVRIIGRDGRLRADGVEVNMNQLYGGQEKYVLVELSVPAGRPEEVRQLARAACRYEDAIHNREAQSDATVSTRYSASAEEVGRSINVEVKSEIVLNVIAEKTDLAVDLYDQGRQDDAVKELRRSASDLRQMSQDAPLPAPAVRRIAEMEEQADLLEREGLDTRNRKSIRSESHQIRTQQKSSF